MALASAGKVPARGQKFVVFGLFFMVFCLDCNGPRVKIWHQLVKNWHQLASRVLSSKERGPPSKVCAIILPSVGNSERSLASLRISRECFSDCLRGFKTADRCQLDGGPVPAGKTPVSLDHRPRAAAGLV
mgnify:CR=1 FL=1